MNGYSIQTDDVVAWLRSKEAGLASARVKLTGIIVRTQYVPAVCGDFDAVSHIGRIAFWVTGEVDFDVLRREGSGSPLFRHEHVERIGDPELDRAFEWFTEMMCSK